VFTPSGPVAIGEGTHEVRAFVADKAGRLARVVTRSFQTDLTTPDVNHRVLPPSPAQANWYRRLPRVALVARDADNNSGIARIEYSINGGPFTTYSTPFEIAEGKVSVAYRAVDVAGHVTGTKSMAFTTDITPPVAKALAPSPTLWIRHLGFLGLGPKTAQLNYSVFDARPGGIVTETERRNLKVIVIVHDALGNAVRRIDAGTVVVKPGVTTTASVTWDGTDQSGLGFLGLGPYYYRVIAMDEAGNWTETGESQPIQIVL
jgi:hypothetical protein